jgi:hypothetical protein
MTTSAGTDGQELLPSVTIERRVGETSVASLLMRAPGGETAQLHLTGGIGLGRIARTTGEWITTGYWSRCGCGGAEIGAPLEPQPATANPAAAISASRFISLYTTPGRLAVTANAG